MHVTNSEVDSEAARNDEAARQDKLVGAKHQAVKVILELPEPCRLALLHTASCFGWERVFAGD